VTPYEDRFDLPSPREREVHISSPESGPSAG
jgi:hypothetical protein